MDPKDMAFAINGALLKSVMDYLSQRPWREVAGLIQEMQALPQLQTKNAQN